MKTPTKSEAVISWITIVAIFGGIAYMIGGLFLLYTYIGFCMFLCIVCLLIYKYRNEP